jgi:hypothetical protein
MLMTLKECALAYVRDLKWSIFPCAPRSKKPLIKWGPYQTRLPTPEEVEKWWTKWPDANVGIICGKISGNICVDIDSPEAQEFYRAEYGEIHNTIRQTTGKPGGLHLIFSYPLDGRPYRNVGDVEKANSTIEIHCRGDGGFFVAAPSIHPNGTQYKWVLDPLESPDDLLDLPEEVKKLWGYGPKISRTSKAFKEPASAKKAKAKTFDPARYLEGADEPGYPGAGEGGRPLGRDIACTSLCGHLLNLLPSEETRSVLYGWAKLCRPEFPEDQVDKILKSIMGRRGLEKMIEPENGDADISGIDIMKYPDGSFLYKVYTSVMDKAGDPVWAIMRPEDLAGQTGFRIKLMNITKVLLAPVKAKEWSIKITAALANAREIVVEEDESIIGEIRLKIWQAVSSFLDYPDEPDPAGRVRQGEIALFKEVIYFNSTAIFNRFINTKETMKREKLHEYLSRFARKKQSHRFGDKTVFCWSVGLEEIRPAN